MTLIENAATEADDAENEYCEGWPDLGTTTEDHRRSGRWYRRPDLGTTAEEMTLMENAATAAVAATDADDAEDNYCEGWDEQNDITRDKEWKRRIKKMKKEKEKMKSHRK